MTKRLLAGASLSVVMLAGHAAGLTEADLRWDLSYRSALRDHPIGEREFMAFWPARYPSRTIHEMLAKYDGEPIEASLLLEKPDGHTGDPQGNWYFKTRNGAKVCSFHQRSKEGACKEMDPRKVERFVREVMAFRQLPDQASDQNTMGSTQQEKQVLINYMGYVSVYVDGKSLQRPIALSEWLGVGNPQQQIGPEVGRFENAIARATLPDADFALRQARQEADARNGEFADAVRRGDVRRMARVLDQSSDRGAALMAAEPSPLALAAGNGQKDAIELLLKRGAYIDAGDSAALRAAVRANDGAMVDFLLSRRAKVDPPRNLNNPNERVSASPLSEAVDAGNDKMAELLIRRGADVNINLRRSVLARAAGELHYGLVDLLLKNRAIPDNAVSDEGRTALLAAMLNVNKSSARPDDPQGDQQAAGVLQDIEQIARRLVAAGANLNYVGDNCATAYSIAADARREALQRALAGMGADIEASRRCSAVQRNGRILSNQGTEAKARAEIANDTRRLLRERDYTGLEKLHDKLNSDKVRTPSGIWGLAVFYAELKNYPQRTRKLDYWTAEEAAAAQWEAKFPKSAAAQQFHAYLLYGRALSFRGNGRYDEIAKDDLAPMGKAIDEAYVRLQKMDANGPRKPATVDANWYRARVDVLPYTDLFHSHFPSAWQGGSRIYPDYHEMYFSAAYHSLPKWAGAPDGVEQIARQAAKGKGADREAMYARVYWYLDQIEYHGKIFEDSMVDWDDMKASFEAMVKTYPDPWNLNAYAYFACKAGDYGTMSSVLARIGEQAVFSAWGSGGESEYQRCVKNLGADTRSFAADLAARNLKFQEAQYYRLISYANAKRRQLDPRESLRALEAAKEASLKVWKGNGMRTHFNMALTLMDLSRYEDAVKSLKFGLEQQPDFVGAKCQLGLAYDHLGRKNEARAQLEACAAHVKENEDLSALSKEERGEAEGQIRQLRAKFQAYGIAAPGA